MSNGFPKVVQATLPWGLRLMEAEDLTSNGQGSTLEGVGQPNPD